MIRNVLAVCVLGVLALAGWSVWQQLDRPVRAVRVEGRLSGAEQAAIRAVVSRHLDHGLLSLDVQALGRNIRELSWPRSVQVRRQWPDALVIKVEKESVVAAWGDGGYLNSAGKVVRLAETEGLDGGSDSVPVLVAAMSEPRRAMEVYQMLESRVNRAGLSIRRLEENALGEWLVTLNDGMEVALGNEFLAKRIGRFLLAYRTVLEDRADDVVHVDLRYDSGVAVGWKQRQETGTEYALR